MSTADITAYLSSAHMLGLHKNNSFQLEKMSDLFLNTYHTLYYKTIKVIKNKGFYYKLMVIQTKSRV